MSEIETLSLTERIQAFAASLTEGQPLTARALQAMGTRAAIDQALSRMARRGTLLRVSRGLYVLPRQTRFGSVPPEPAKVVEEIAKARGVRVARSGASAANELGLTRQVPIRQVFLTSGKSLRLLIGKQEVELRHAPSWQLAYAGSRTGAALRALEWMGPAHAGSSVEQLKRLLPVAERREMSSAIGGRMPQWMTAAVSQLATR